MQTTLDSFYRKRTRLPADSESDFSPKRTARKLFDVSKHIFGHNLGVNFKTCELISDRRKLTHLASWSKGESSAK